MICQFVISDPSHEVELSYVDDVVAAFLAEIDGQQACGAVGADIPAIGFSSAIWQAESRRFMRCGTHSDSAGFRGLVQPGAVCDLSFLCPGRSATSTVWISSPTSRGSLAEFIKQKHFGQIFVSRTKPGVTRGNHYHHTKTEKFFVVEGDGLIRMRAIEGGPVTEYYVSRQRLSGNRHPTGIHALHHQCGRRRNGDAVLVE